MCCLMGFTSKSAWTEGPQPKTMKIRDYYSRLPLAERSGHRDVEKRTGLLRCLYRAGRRTLTTFSSLDTLAKIAQALDLTPSQNSLPRRWQPGEREIQYSQAHRRRASLFTPDSGVIRQNLNDSDRKLPTGHGPEVAADDRGSLTATKPEIHSSALRICSLSALFLSMEN